MRGAQALQKLVHQTSGFVKRQSPTILICVGAVGVVATSVATAKATVKATKLLEEAKEEKGAELTKKETFKVAAPAYIPAVVLGATTISCMFGADIINKRRQAALVSAYTMLDQSFKEYKDKVTDLHGEEAETEVRNEIAKDKRKDIQLDKPHSNDVLLFFDEYSNRYFWKTMVEVRDAEYHLNRNFALRGYAELNEFYEFLGLEPTAYGAEVGWSMEAGGAWYGYDWVDFRHDFHESTDPNEPSYYTISMPFGPTADFMSY